MKNKEILSEMMSNIPTTKTGDIDDQILRIGILSEIDAINLYEQLAELSTNENVKNTLLDIAKEEKVHVSEFETLLNKKDSYVKIANKEGEKEVENSEDLKEANEKLYGKSQTKKLHEMRSLFKKING